jgi:hypothetical protein
METPGGVPQPKVPRPIDGKLIAAAKKLKRRPPWARPYATGRTRALWLKIFLLGSVIGHSGLALGALMASKLARVINSLINIGGSAAPPDRPFQNVGRFVFSSLLGIAAHLLTFFVVRTIQEMQDRKWAQSSAPAAAAADPGAPPAAP